MWVSCVVLFIFFFQMLATLGFFSQYENLFFLLTHKYKKNKIESNQEVPVWRQDLIGAKKKCSGSKSSNSSNISEFDCLPITDKFASYKNRPDLQWFYT